MNGPISAAEGKSFHYDGLNTQELEGGIASKTPHNSGEQRCERCFRDEHSNLKSNRSNLGSGEFNPVYNKYSSEAFPRSKHNLLRPTDSFLETINVVSKRESLRSSSRGQTKRKGKSKGRSKDGVGEAEKKSNKKPKVRGDSTQTILLGLMLLGSL